MTDSETESAPGECSVTKDLDETPESGSELQDMGLLLTSLAKIEELCVANRTEIDEVRTRCTDIKKLVDDLSDFKTKNPRARIGRWMLIGMAVNTLIGLLLVSTVFSDYLKALGLKFH